MMDTLIRPAKPEEWQIIQKLNHEVFLDNAQYDPYLDTNDPFKKTTENYYQKHTTSHDSCCIIAFENDSAVGYLIGAKGGYNYRTVKTAVIENMGVTPEFRSQGVGSQLVDRFRQWCKERQFDTILANCYYGNKKAIQFYQKQGLMPIDMSLEGKV